MVLEMFVNLLKFNNVLIIAYTHVPNMSSYKV